MKNTKSKQPDKPSQEDVGVIDLDTDSEPDAQPEVIDLDTEMDREPDPRTEALVTVLEQHPQYPPSPKWDPFMVALCLGVRRAELRAQLDWMRQHFKITPKPKRDRGRGRPRGSGLSKAVTKAVKLWTLKGLTDPEIYIELGSPANINPDTLRRSRKRRIAKQSKEEQARIRAAHQAERFKRGGPKFGS